MPVSFHLFINKWMNSIQLTHFSWSFFFPLNSKTRWERTPHSKVITQRECSSVLEGELTIDRWHTLRQWNKAVADNCYNKRRSSLILFSCQDTKIWSQLFFKKEEEEECIPKSRLPRAAGTIPALLSYTILVGGQIFLTFYVELAIFLGWAATLRKSF